MYSNWFSGKQSKHKSTAVDRNGLPMINLQNFQKTPKNKQKSILSKVAILQYKASLSV